MAMPCGCPEGGCVGHSAANSKPVGYGNPPIGKPFAPGKSGNPSGQPKWLKEVRDGLCSLLPETRNRLGEIIRSGSDKDSTAAAKVVLEYTVPKPKQTHRVEGKGGDPLALLSPEQLVEFIKGRKE